MYIYFQLLLAVAEVEEVVQEPRSQSKHYDLQQRPIVCIYYVLQAVLTSLW